MSLSDEDRKRIEEEEGFRAEARLRGEMEARRKLDMEEKARREQRRRPTVRKGFLWCLGAIVFLILLSLLASGTKDTPREPTSARPDIPEPRTLRATSVRPGVPEPRTLTATAPQAPAYQP